MEYIDDEFQDILDMDLVVHCEYEAQAVNLCRFLHDKGMRWDDNESYINETRWRENKQHTCYILEERTYETLRTCQQAMMEVVSYDDFNEVLKRFIGESLPKVVKSKPKQIKKRQPQAEPVKEKLPEPEKIPELFKIIEGNDRDRFLNELNHFLYKHPNYTKTEEIECSSGYKYRMMLKLNKDKKCVVK